MSRLCNSIRSPLPGQTSPPSQPETYGAAGVQIWPKTSNIIHRSYVIIASARSSLGVPSRAILNYLFLLYSCAFAALIMSNHARDRNAAFTSPVPMRVIFVLASSFDFARAVWPRSRNRARRKFRYLRNAFVVSRLRCSRSCSIVVS